MFFKILIYVKTEDIILYFIFTINYLFLYLAILSVYIYKLCMYIIHIMYIYIFFNRVLIYSGKLNV